MLSLLSKLFGQDITKISLPVILAEPHTAIMKATEVLAKNEQAIAKAAEAKDSMERLILVTSHFLGQFATYSCRLPKKPFNPMLGETYELVTEDYRFFGEQVSHHPPVSAFIQEGRGYKAQGFIDLKTSLGFGSGKGLLRAESMGTIDYMFEDTQECISGFRPVALAYNLIFGTYRVDQQGPSKLINHRTGEYALVEFYPHGYSTEPRLEGKIYDSNGIARYEVEGEWAQAIYIKNLETGETKLLFEQEERMPNSLRQFGYDYNAVNLNYICPEMREWLAPTDSRLRGDMRLYEEG